MAIIDLATENFQAEITKSDKTVLVDFWAVWCGPCQMMAPILHELEEEVPDVQIGKVNVDEQMELARPVPCCQHSDTDRILRMVRK